jgi:hypothetical protein
MNEDTECVLKGSVNVVSAHSRGRAVSYVLVSVFVHV